MAAAYGVAADFRLAFRFDNADAAFCAGVNLVFVDLLELRLRCIDIDAVETGQFYLVFFAFFVDDVFADNLCACRAVDADCVTACITQSDAVGDNLPGISVIIEINSLTLGQTDIVRAYRAAFAGSRKIYRMICAVVYTVFGNIACMRISDAYGIGGAIIYFIRLQLDFFASRHNIYGVVLAFFQRAFL